ncbi:MAG TPA: hypothetical protein VF221_23405, partial [Chloroflexota bacterium]
ADHYERSYAALKKLPDVTPGEVVDAILAWARTAYKLAPSSLVLERLHEGEAAARAVNDTRRLALTLNWIGNVHFYLGVPSDGIPALVEGDRLARELGDEDLVLAWTFLMAESLTDRNPRAALDQINRVIELSRTSRYEDIEAHASGMKAMTLARLGRFTEAKAALERALNLARQIHSPVKESDVLSAGAHMYFDMGDARQGIECSRVGAQLAFEVGGYECGIYSLYSIGMGRLAQELWAEAISAFEVSAERAESSRIGSEWLKNRIRAGLAIARANTGSATAIGEMEEALARANSFEDDYTAALLSRSLGDHFTRAGDFDRAQQYLDDAFAYYRRNDMLPYLPGILRSLATLQECRSDADGAAAARKEAARVATQLASEIARSSVPAEKAG